MKANGKKIEIKGVTVAELDDQLRILSLDTYFDPIDMFRQMETEGPNNRKEELSEGNTDLKEPVSGQESQCPFMRQ